MYLGSVRRLLLVGIGAGWTIVVEHVREDIFSIFESLRHLLIVRIQSLAKWHD